MKKYLVIGNPIQHSYHPSCTIIGLKKIILMLFMKKKIKEKEIQKIISEVKNG